MQLPVGTAIFLRSMNGFLLDMLSLPRLFSEAYSKSKILAKPKRNERKLMICSNQISKD